MLNVLIFLKSLLMCFGVIFLFLFVRLVVLSIFFFLLSLVLNFWWFLRFIVVFEMSILYVM